MTMMKTSFGYVVPPVQSTTDKTSTTMEGLPAYEKDLKSKIAQIAFCGLPGNTFYADKEVSMDMIIATVKEGAKKCPEFLGKALAVGREEGFVKFPAQVGMAVLAKAAPDVFEKYFGKCIRIPSDLFAFMVYFQHENNGKTGGRVLKRTVSKWLNANITAFWAVKYAGNNAGFSLADMVRISHPKAESAEANALYGYLTTRDSNKRQELADAVPYLKAVESLGKDLPEVAARNIKDFRIPHEAVTGRVHKLTTDMWLALIETMPVMALLRNLNTAERHLGDKMPIALIRNKLTASNVRKAKILPYRFMTAYKAVGNKELRNIISDAVDAAAENIPKIEGQTVVAIDRSGSMVMDVLQTACIVGYGLRRAYGPDTTLVEFDDQDSVLPYSDKESIISQASKITNRGGTETVRVMKYVTPETKNLIIITDGQENSGSNVAAAIGRHRANGYSLRVFIVDVSRYSYSGQLIQTNHFDSFYIYGMTDATWGYISLASRGFGSLVDNIEGAVV